MRETILVVDDISSNLQILVRILAAENYRVLVAEDGSLALEQARREKPDLVLLDVMMPGLDGFDVCRRLKDCPETQETPVLFITALTALQHKVRAFQAGGVDYIAKPYQKEEVLARVSAHLTIARQRRQLQGMVDQRGRFMRIAAHDLRNPLAAAIGWAGLGLSLAEHRAAQTAFQKIEGALERMKNIIDDFLCLSVLDASAKKQVAPINLRQMVLQVLEEQESGAQAKSIKLQGAGLADSATGLGIASYTHQILTNYISNAIKYSPSGTTVEVTLAPQGDFWRLSVRDQGPGIPASERGRLFQEFYQTSNKPTGGESSTGLGLSIVRALAQAQNGGVGADFPEQGGSSFWFEIARG